MKFRGHELKEINRKLKAQRKRDKRKAKAENSFTKEILPKDLGAKNV
jgi:hypothetical protein